MRKSGTDYDGRLVRVGDDVFFKEDVEGTGVVIDIVKGNGWTMSGRPPTTFVIGNPAVPNGYRWHPMATFDHRRDQMVVRTDRVWLA